MGGRSWPLTDLAKLDHQRQLRPNCGNNGLMCMATGCSQKKVGRRDTAHNLLKV